MICDVNARKRPVQAVSPARPAAWSYGLRARLSFYGQEADAGPREPAAALAAMDRIKLLLADARPHDRDGPHDREEPNDHD